MSLYSRMEDMYSRDGKGVRVCITKFPNNCIPKYFNDCDEKYHLWVCLDYDKKIYLLIRIHNNYY